MNWVPKKWLHSFTSLPFGGCLCALFGLWCVSRQMELTPAVLSSHKVLWWRGTVAPEAGDISLQWSLSSHCLYLDEKAVVIRWSCLTLRWQLCPSARGGQAGSCCTWKYEIVLLTFGYWLSKKNPGVVFFLKALGIDYLVFITWMQLKMLLWKILPVQTFPVEKKNQKKPVRIYFRAHNWRHNNLF